MVDNVLLQLQQVAERAGLPQLFASLSFDSDAVVGLEACGEGEIVEIVFANADGPVGVLIVDVYDSGDPDDAGRTVGLRGWRLSEDVASV